jgi:hypothetical protein
MFKSWEKNSFFYGFNGFFNFIPHKGRYYIPYLFLSCVYFYSLLFSSTFISQYQITGKHILGCS